jgi:hypothetical protein
MEMQRAGEEAALAVYSSSAFFSIESWIMYVENGCTDVATMINTLNMLYQKLSMGWRKK